MLMIFARGCGVSDVTDPDGDQLTNAQERELGTDPNNADTDGDGLNDNGELSAGTDPLDPDTDGDGLADGAEVRFGLDPFTPNGPGAALAAFLDSDSNWRCRGDDKPFDEFQLRDLNLGTARLQPSAAAPALDCYGIGDDLICPEARSPSDGALWSFDAWLTTGANDIDRLVLTVTRVDESAGSTDTWDFDAVLQ